jgi:hypothetical protein
VIDLAYWADCGHERLQAIAQLVVPLGNRIVRYRATHDIDPFEQDGWWSDVAVSNEAEASKR